MPSIYKEVFVETLASIAKLKLELIKRLFVPVLLLTAVDTAMIYYLFDNRIYFLLLIKLIFYTLIAITTHRLVLLGPDSVSLWGFFKWGKRESYFTLYVVLLAVILIPAGFLSNFSGLIAIAATVLFFWITGRFALTFPGIAIDEKMTFDLSWNWTRNHNILMFVIVGIVPTIFFFTSALLAQQFAHFFYFWNLFMSIFLIFEIALISHAYKSIKQRVANR